MSEQSNKVQQDLLRAAAEESFMRRHSYSRFPGRQSVAPCAHFLRQEPCTRGDYDCRLPVQFWERLRLYVDKDGRAIISVQPDIPPKDYITVTSLCAAFAAKWNLFFRISNEESWWQRDKSLLIEFCGKDGAI